MASAHSPSYGAPSASPTAPPRRHPRKRSRSGTGGRCPCMASAPPFARPIDAQTPGDVGGGDGVDVLARRHQPAVTDLTRVEALPGHEVGDVLDADGPGAGVPGQ